MSTDNLTMDEITEARRQALATSIRTIGVEELKALGEGLFVYHDHPWRQKFFDFLAENSGETFHYGSTQDRVHIIYCDAKDKGMWFMPGSGMGPLQAKGLAIMKQLAAEAK